MYGQCFHRPSCPVLLAVLLKCGPPLRASAPRRREEGKHAKPWRGWRATQPAGEGASGPLPDAVRPSKRAPAGRDATHSRSSADASSPTRLRSFGQLAAMPTQAPLLYNLPGSPPCGFVRSLAKHLGVEITLKNLDFAKKEHLSEEYLKINPFHKVPTLVDEDGFIVYESNAIAYYLLRKYAPESDLYPKCYKERARIDIVLAAVASIIQPFQLLFFRPRFWDNIKPSDEEVAAFETNVVQGLQYLVSDGKYATGDNLTLADFCLVANLTVCLEVAALRRPFLR